MAGLLLSSFSLIFIQGIMKGLQRGLIERSKKIHGDYQIVLQPQNRQSNNLFFKKIKEELPGHVLFYREYEIEVMIRQKSYLAPTKIHGVHLQDSLPSFLQSKDFNGLVAGSDLLTKVRADFLDSVFLVAPGVSDNIMGEVPRFVSESISDMVYTELPEVDEFESWVRLPVVQNLLRTPSFNKIRIFGKLSDGEILQLKTRVKDFPETQLLTWEEMNETLVWSLALETRVMLFLFISMSLLVAIAITSGFLIFYNKIRIDLMSFWILGMSQKILMRLSFEFTLLISSLTILLGAFLGFGALKILQAYGGQIVPDIFLEREVPVYLDSSDVALSLLIPLVISLFFILISYTNFKKENRSFLTLIRGLS